MGLLTMILKHVHGDLTDDVINIMTSSIKRNTSVFRYKRRLLCVFSGITRRNSQRSWSHDCAKVAINDGIMSSSRHSIDKFESY